MPGLKFIFLISLALFLSCSKKDNAKKDENPNFTLVTPANLPEVQKKYQFLGERCDTGSQLFYETDPTKLQKEYCSTLLDEEKNRHCARTLRHAQFKKDCSDVMGSLGLMIDEQGEIKAIPQYEGIKDAFSAELLLINLWVDKVESPFQDATIIKTEYIIESREMLDALVLCGQQFSGPSCVAYREHIRLDAGLLNIDGQQVYYYLAKFNQHRQRFLVTYPVKRKGIEAYFDQADFYIVDDEVTKFSVTSNFRNMPELIYVGSSTFSRLSKPRALQLMEASENSEQLVHLASWLFESTIFESEKEFLQKEVSEIFSKKSKNFGKIPPTAVFQYLDVLKAMLTAEEYEQALVDIVDDHDKPESKTLISTAAAQLLHSNPDLDIYLEELLPALSGEYPPAMVLALQVLQQKQYALSNSTINQIIKLFVHYDPQVAEEAYKTLLSYEPGPGLIANLKKYFDGKNEQAKKYAFLTIASIDDPSTTEILLEAIDKIKDPVIKAEMMEVLSSRRFTETDIDGLVITMKSSDSYSLQRQAIDWLFSVGTTEANIELIDFMKEDATGLRFYAANRLPDLNADQNSYDYLRNVLVFEKPIDIEDYLVRGVIEIAANPNQKNITDKTRESGLRDVFELLRSESEFERSLVLDELKKVPLPGKLVEKVINEHIAATKPFIGPQPNPFPDVFEAMPEIIGNIPDQVGTMLLVKNLKRKDNNFGSFCIEALRNRFDRLGMLEPGATNEIAKNIDTTDPSLGLLLIDFLGKSNHSEGNAALISKTEIADDSFRSRIMSYLEAPNVNLLPAQASKLKDVLLKPGNPDYKIKSRIMDLLLAIDSTDESNSAILETFSMPEHVDLVQKAFAALQTRPIGDSLAQKVGTQILKSYDDEKIKTWLVDVLIQMVSDAATQSLIKALGIAYPDLVTKMLEDLKQRTIPKEDSTANAFGELLSKPVSKEVLDYSYEQLLALDSHLAHSKLAFGLKSDFPEISKQIVATLKEKQIFAPTDTSLAYRQKLAATELVNQILRTDLEASFRKDLIDLIREAKVTQVHETLISAMSHPDTETRAYIIDALRQVDLSVVYSSTEYTYTLPGALAKQVETSPYPEVRIFCLDALSKISHSNVPKELVSLYFEKTQTEFYKEEAYRSAIFDVILKQRQLFDFGHFDKIKTKGFASIYQDVRLRTVDLIDIISTSDSPDAHGGLAGLIQNIHNPDPETRQMIIDYLDANILTKKTGSMMIDALSIQLVSSDRDVRYHSVRYLGILYQQCVRCDNSTIKKLENLVLKQKTTETDPEILDMLEQLIPTPPPSESETAAVP